MAYSLVRTGVRRCAAGRAAIGQAAPGDPQRAQPLAAHQLLFPGTLPNKSAEATVI